MRAWTGIMAAVAGTQFMDGLLEYTLGWHNSPLFNMGYGVFLLGSAITLKTLAEAK